MAQVKDPVCGMTIDSQQAADKVEYKSQTYYFCSAGCKTTFEKDPEQYVRSAEGHQHHH